MNNLSFHSCFHISLNDIAELVCNNNHDSMKSFVENFLYEEEPVMEMSCIKVYAETPNSSIYDEYLTSFSSVKFILFISF